MPPANRAARWEAGTIPTIAAKTLSPKGENESGYCKIHKRAKDSPAYGRVVVAWFHATLRANIPETSLVPLINEQ